MDALTRVGYLAHAQSPAYARSLARSVEVIAAHHNYAASVSWGKDSVAMLSLVADISPAAVVMFGRYQTAAEVLEDVDSVRDAVLSKPEMRQLRYNEIIVPGEWQVFERVGHAFTTPETTQERAAVATWKREFSAVMLEAGKRAGASGYLIGMRGSESRARALNIACRGSSYVTADGRGTALPLARWSAEDVWATLVGRSLPWLRIYDNARNRDRQRSDFTWSVGGEASHLRMGGEGATWLQTYPDQMYAWLDRWPELRRSMHV